MELHPKSWTLLGCFMKYSYDHRLLIVSRVKQGESANTLVKEYHINKTQILAWVRMWDTCNVILDWNNNHIAVLRFN